MGDKKLDLLASRNRITYGRLCKRYLPYLGDVYLCLMCLSLSTLTTSHVLPAIFLPFSPPSPFPSSSTRRRRSPPLSLVIAGDIPCLQEFAMTTPSTSSRPYTSSGREADGRPTTSSRYPDPYDRDPQYTYSQDYSFDEEDEESEAEDVFAFGPPSTADSVASPASPIHRLISQPPPVYDPYGGNIIPTNVVAGPSTLHTRHPYPHPQSPTVETPPSTDSQTTGNPYALQRTPSSYQTSSARMHSGARSAVSSAISSREVHISLPRTQDRIEEEQAEDPQKSRPPSSVTSFPSLDSAGASMKCVLFNF